jgi:hypothetical protein
LGESAKLKPPIFEQPNRSVIVAGVRAVTQAANAPIGGLAPR